MDILGFDKIFYHPEKVEKLRNRVPQFPVNATVSLGNYCNHKCRWCTVYAAQESAVRHMDKDKLLSFLHRAAARGLKAVGYVGNGEPTAYPNFSEVVREIHGLGLEQGMFTNGYLLDRCMDEVLDCFTYIRISLDAGSTAIHDDMHDVNGQFEKIMENIGQITSRRTKGTPAIGVQYAVHHENISDMIQSAMLSKEAGVDYFSVKPVFNRGAVGMRIDKNELTPTELVPVVAEIRQRFESPDFTVYYRPHQIDNEVADVNLLAYDRCIAGQFNLQVYEDGRVVCCGPGQISVGTMDQDLDIIEQNLFDTIDKLDLSRCPSGCRYHPLNHIADTILNPERASRYHVNFI